MRFRGIVPAFDRNVLYTPFDILGGEGSMDVEVTVQEADTFKTKKYKVTLKRGASTLPSWHTCAQNN